MKFGRQVSSLLIARAAIIGLAFLTSVIIARSVGPGGKGALTVLNSLATLTSVIAGLGLATGAIHLHKANRYSIGTITGVSTLVWAVALAACAVLVGFAGDDAIRVLLNASAGEELDRSWLWLSLATVPGLLMASLIQSIWLVDNRMRLYAAVSIGSQALGLVLAWILVALLDWGVTGALMANLGAQCLTVGGSLVWLQSIGQPGRFHSVTTAFRPLIQASFGGYLSSIVANLFKHGEAVLLAVLLSLQQVGHYGVAIAFYQLLIELPRAIVWPLARHMTEGGATAGEVTVRSLRLLPLTLVVPLAAMASVAPFLIRWVYGADFAPSGTLLAYMAPGVLFRSIHLVVYSYLVVTGRLHKIAASVGIAAFTNLALDFLIVPSWGLAGVALSNVASELILAVLSITVFLKESRGRLATVFARRSDIEDLSRYLSRMVMPWRF